MKMWIMLILLSSMFVISQKLKSYERRVTSRRKELLFRWKAARSERTRWKDDRVCFFDFNHSEYQRLFEIEIGAEDVYLMYVGKHARGISIVDYHLEKRQSEQEESI